MSKEDRQRRKAERVRKRDERIAAAKQDWHDARAKQRETSAQAHAEMANIRKDMGEASAQFREDMASVREDAGTTWNDLRDELGLSKGMLGRIASGVPFSSLGVTVREDENGAYVTAGALGGSRRLGPLKGAYAEVTDGTRVHRVAGATLGTVALGPAGALVGLSKKAKASAFVVFADGTVHERKLDGNAAVRGAQSDAVKFNALASAAE